MRAERTCRCALTETGRSSCYAVALVNPADDKAAPYDQTDEIPIALRK